MRRLSGLLILALLIGCAKPTPTLIPPTATPILPTATTSLTATSVPTSTPLPTDTPKPTATNTSIPTKAPIPTSTPVLTNTPAPTNTPMPTDTPKPATVGEALVVKIVDGDTIDVSINGEIYRVRYIGMDTPERGELGYAEATAVNAELVGGKTVRLEKDVSETDKYGRLLRYVYVGDLFVNAELLRRGYAQVMTIPPDVAHADEFLELQREAREARRGLWAPPIEVPTSAPPATGVKVEIVYIFYDGQKGRKEPDEYAEIKNTGSVPVNLAGWRLNADDPGQDFVFPDFELQPGQSCRVYTNEHHPEWGGFSFGRGSAIWANKGECGHLYDPSGREVSTYCY